MPLKYYERFLASRRYIFFHVTREAHDEAREKGGEGEGEREIVVHLIIYKKLVKLRRV